MQQLIGQYLQPRKLRLLLALTVLLTVLVYVGYNLSIRKDVDLRKLAPLERKQDSEIRSNNKYLSFASLLPKQMEDSQSIEQNFKQKQSKPIFPNQMLIGLGCKKCGSSTLHGYITKLLRVHTSLVTANKAHLFGELHYWDRTCKKQHNSSSVSPWIVTNCSFIDYLTVQHLRGGTADHTTETLTRYEIFAEKSPSYIASPITAMALCYYANLMQSYHYPLKFIVIFRDPSTRLWSDFYQTFTKYYDPSYFYFPFTQLFFFIFKKLYELQSKFEIEISDHVEQMEKMKKWDSSKAALLFIPQLKGMWKIRQLLTHISLLEEMGLSKQHIKETETETDGSLEFTTIQLWIDVFDTLSMFTKDIFNDKLFTFARGCYYPQLLLYLTLLSPEFIRTGALKVVQLEHLTAYHTEYTQHFISWLGLRSHLTVPNFNVTITSAGHKAKSPIPLQTQSLLRGYYLQCNNQLFTLLNKHKPYLFFLNNSFLEWS
ncbi:hypothetical protein RFI_28234 [Reticulomyxa filosa]|uniref:Sulfotransferase domain-containing protein n=1 Tax=Reticulomyxa filosa TaxID=46433 RepID=X6M6R0_RETFI|nr:hypothetical protein RFI_28234 [Reticulomyxa filosa]|eukprot:ETO09152.1 hypothetical protein RFI_28234 [Reticulomyxa filosa]